MWVFDCHLKAGFWLRALGRAGKGGCVLTSSFQMKSVVPKCICSSPIFSPYFFLFFCDIQKKEKGGGGTVQITTIHLEGKKGKNNRICTLCKGGKTTTFP